MPLAPVPTPEVLRRKPPALAITAIPGTTLGRLGEPSTASANALYKRSWRPLLSSRIE
jgi:hypothetical protein